MKKFQLPLLLSLVAIQPLFGSENLKLKRISEFWKDEAFDQAKTQILQFLAEHPESDYCDNLHAMLGDLFIQEKNYQKALQAYDQIAGTELRNKIEPNYLQALLEMEDYRSILKKSNKKSSNPKVNYLVGEACFRLGRQAPDPETQKTLYIQAASHYNLLARSEYAYESLLPLAEIYKTLGEGPKATALYLELAERKPEEKENLLFQAAYLQSTFDKCAAAKTFKNVYELAGKNMKSAAYNHLKLLFELDEFAAFIDAYQTMQPNIPHDKSAGLHYYLSKSYFETGEINKAVTSLENCEGKSAYLLLAGCAEKLGDIKLLKKATELLSQQFPSDVDTAKAHLISAQISVDQGDVLHAQSNMEYVLKNFPNYPDRENLLYNYGILLSRNSLWEHCRINFENLLKEYPDTIFKNEAWRYLLNASLKEGNREHFSLLLGKALSQSNIFSDEEQKTYHLLFIKLLFEQENKKELGEQLVSFLDRYPHSAEGHLIAASLYEEDTNFFKIHAEQALALDPYLQDSEQLHLKLYNIYVQTPSEHDLAAKHLYQSIATSHAPIQEENLKWLASYYFNKKQDPAALEKALYLHEKIALQGPLPANEKELLKYAELLLLEKKLPERIAILELLSQKQKEENALPWKMQRQTLFELASAYKECGEYQKAIAAYELLINTSTHMPSYFSKAATLERAKLQYHLLPTVDLKENSPEITPILSALKDLQLKKKLHSEPLHLEAALEYVTIMKTLSPEEKQTERTIFLLKRVKEDFSTKGDIYSKEYHSQRSVLPDKATLLEDYLDYIDAEVLRLEGKIARSKKLYQKLQEKPLDPSLQRRINISMEAFYDAR
jgi:tetratricopeptide (TPR) repeat protein